MIALAVHLQRINRILMKRVTRQADCSVRAPTSDIAGPNALAPAAPQSRPAPGKIDNGGAAGVIGRVLLVEDNPINQCVAKAMLDKLGLDWTLAHNGAEAVELVRRTAFDLVLMDCQMPVMDGFEAAAIIRQMPLVRGVRLPIVALTGNAMQGDEQRCLDAGMDAFLGKPYTLTMLQAALSPWLPAHSPAQPAQTVQTAQTPPAPAQTAQTT